MDFSASKNKVTENPSQSSTEARNDVPAKEEVRSSKEVKDAADVGRSAYVEAVGLDESVETTGRVSEVLSNSNEKAVSSGGAPGAKITIKIDPAVIRENLLKNMPSEEVMKKQIETEIRKEIDYLHKKAIKMMTLPGKVNYFEMNNLMKKIRELKTMLMQLLKASIDGLKTLWLRFVHGIM